MRSTKTIGRENVRRLEIRKIESVIARKNSNLNRLISANGYKNEESIYNFDC